MAYTAQVNMQAIGNHSMLLQHIKCVYGHNNVSPAYNKQFPTILCYVIIPLLKEQWYKHICSLVSLLLDVVFVDVVFVDKSVEHTNHTVSTVM